MQNVARLVTDLIGVTVTATLEPSTSDAVVSSDIRIADFAIYDDDLEEPGGVGFKATGDLHVEDGDADYTRGKHTGIVAVVLDVDDDHSEVLSDVYNSTTDLAAMRRAAALLTMVADRLAAMTTAAMLASTPQTVGDLVDAASEIGVKPSDVMRALDD